MRVTYFVISISVMCRVMAFQFMKAGQPRMPPSLSRPHKFVVKSKPNDGKDGSPPENPSFEMSGGEKGPKKSNTFLQRRRLEYDV